jgi:TonB-dependent starch-binding outer membrane protein SusC
MKKFKTKEGIYVPVKKMLLMARLTMFLILLGLMQVSAESYSQTAKLSIKMNNVPIADVFNEIEKISKFRLFYDNQLVDLSQRVSVDAEGETIFDVLDEAFLNTGLDYEIMDRFILVKAQNEQLTRAESIYAAQQPSSVSGKITDNSNQPLPGVTVVVKGTTQGTVTNADGEYTLTNIPDDAVLQFSFVGMRTQEVAVEGRRSINVTMVEETIGIEEVVAVGYGTMKKSDITGSVSSVPMDLLKNQPVRNLEDMLQGRVAGMTLTRTSGQPTSGAKIRIRGPNSISGNNAPLYVVDGVIGGSMGSVHDIESIEVLKDASATAIYGERASNGVILITTKKATTAEPHIRVSLNSGINFQNTDYPDKMNAAEYAEFINLQRGEGTFSSSEIEEFRRTGGTDWTDLIMRTGIKNDHNISYSQKFNKFGIYLSGRYLDEEGTMVNSNVGGNYQVRSNVDFAPNDRLSFNFDLKAHKNESWNGNLSTGTSKAHPLIQSLLWSPTEPVWSDEENGEYNLNDSWGALSDNPYMRAMEQQYFVMSHGVYATLVGNYDITDWLTYNVTGYAAKSTSQSGNYDNKWLDPNDPQASRSYSDGFTWRLINRVDINKTFYDAHNVLLTGVYEAEAHESWGLSGTGRNMPLPDLARYYKIDLSNIQSASSSFGQSSRLAYLARLNYNYMSRYYFTASYRVDAQSGPTDRKEENKYGAFPSFAASWRLSEEPFMKGGFFDNLKVRAGWGITGNPSGFPYTKMSKANNKFGLGSEVLGYVPGTPANPNIKWEETAQTDVGLDATILEGKLSLSLDYFHKKTTDLLTEKVLPGYYGYGGSASYTQNLGQINNNGYEATINYTPIQTSNVYWGLNFNVSTVRNEVIDLGEQEAFLTGTNGNGFLDVRTYRVEEGLALGSMWGYKFLGIWGTNEAAEAEKYGAQPGDPKWEDVNTDYAITLTEDGQKIGDANPDFIWGLSSALSYKNFDFDITLQGMHGQDVFNLLRAAMSTAHPDSRSITLKEPAFDYWTPENQNTPWPNIHSTSDKKKLNSTQWIEDGSWVKVKYVGVTYHVPRQWINFADLSVSLSGNELLTFTKYKGYDPEVSASGTDDDWGGCDFGTFPIPKSVNLGVILEF